MYTYVCTHIQWLMHGTAWPVGRAQGEKQQQGVAGRASHLRVRGVREFFSYKQWRLYLSHGEHVGIARSQRAFLLRHSVGKGSFSWRLK